MSEATNTAGNFRERWLNPRRKRFWAIVLVLLYTLCGFFLAPLVIKNTVVDLFQEDLGRTASIEKVKVNPYVLSLEVQGLEVLDKDNVKLMSFDDFFVNFQLASLFKWAWVFKEVRLDAPYLHFERFKSGETRVENLLADFEAAFPPDPDEPIEQGATSAPRLMVQNLSINSGQVKVRDHVPDSVVELDLSPINISVNELNTLPDVFGEQTVEIILPDDGHLSWSGNLKLVPLHSEGTLILKNFKFDRSIAYLESILPLDAVGGRLSSQFKYRLGMDEKVGITLQVNDLQAQLEQVLVSGLSPTAEFVNIPKIDFSGGQMRYPEQSLKFAKIQIQNPVLTAWRNPDESISIMGLVPESSDSAPANDANSANSATGASAGAAASAWNLSIDEISVDGGHIALTDNSVEPATALTLTDLEIKVTELSNAEGASMPLQLTGNLQQGGSFTFNGDLTVLPELSMRATATTTQIPLALAQTYVKPFARIEIKDGALDSNINIELADMDSVTATGSLQVSSLEINDTIENQKLLGWTLLDIDQFELRSNEVRFSLLDFSEPFGRLVINEDLSTNVAAIIAQQSPANVDEAQAATPNQSATGEPMVFVIGGIKVNDGSMHFADFSLPLPFSTYIAALNGTISTIATNTAKPANIRLEGQVNEFGLARIDGSINVFDPIKHTDMNVEFRNLLMTELSPYTVEFAGREIDEGKLNLGLVYKIKEGQLDGANDIVLNDLVLGKKVDNPDAASLPLGLAVALLKDSDGVIQIDLPIQGDINDPEFKIGGVVWKAITTLLTKIVTAPFRLLGNLIGIDSEDLGQFEFLAGRADLTPPELEKIAQLQKALLERPELVVEIAGVTDNKIDVPALREIRLRQTLNERLGEGLVGDEAQSAMMLDERIRSVVEELFVERFPDVPTDPLKEANKVLPEDDPEGAPVLDELAYATDLWNQMLEAEPVGDQDLQELAAARATVIKDAFLASGEFDAKRVIIAASKQVTSEDSEWVVLELAMASD